MAQGKRTRPGQVFGFINRATRKEGVEHDYAVFKVRTLQEIEHLGAMIETVFENPETFELSEDDKRQHYAALQVLYWVRSNPDIPDYTKEFERLLKARGFKPPLPIKPM